MPDEFPNNSDSVNAGRDEQGLDFSFVLAASVHDMKNSLGMLLTSLEEVIDHAPPQDEVQKNHFSILQYEASRINSELIQLLTIYRINQKNLPFNLDENYISETFEDQVARNDVLFRTKEIELSIGCDPDLAWFYDNELIGNVIHNVLINSARYAKNKVNIIAEMDEKQLVIKIEDDGNGFPGFMIDEAELGSDNRGATDSTQLGLFFAAKIAHFHRKGEVRGEIKLYNGGSLGGGVFEIRLP
ncbi:MAG: K+-sensing histidine kinase KdpD [Cellvibrionaceae bacterium]|jgi:K+-sensing histidine kinase KdpD